MMIFQIGIAVAIAAWCLRFYYKRRNIWKFADEIPGPKGWPLVGSALELTHPTKALISLFKWWEQNGMKTYKFYLGWEPIVVLSTPEEVEALLTSSVLIDKDKRYSFLDPWLGKGLLTSTGQRWRSHRKIITPAFHFSILEQFVEVFRSNADVLVKKFAEFDENTDFNVVPLITNASLDAICESAMGVKINSQQKECKYATAVSNACWYLYIRMTSAHLMFEPIFKISREGRGFNKALSVLHEQVDQVIMSRRKELLEMKSDTKAVSEIGLKKRLAFLDVLLSQDGDGQQMNDSDIRDEVNTFMFEGHDTTTSALCFTLYLLAKHPSVQEKIFEEQKLILGENFDKTLTLREANEMKYLERVIKESLRIFPSVPFYSRCLNEDLQLPDGARIAKGTNVSVATLLMQRNPKLYPEPDKFDPDRFLAENLKGLSPFAYVPFSAGPRNCIGQKYALLEMKCFLGRIIQEYRLSESPDFKPSLAAAIVLKSTNGVCVRMSER